MNTLSARRVGQVVRSQGHRDRHVHHRATVPSCCILFLQPSHNGNRCLRTYNKFSGFVKLFTRCRSNDLLYFCFSILRSQRHVAMIAEMIHSASLIHDDVIDQADFRRGKPSANVIWSHKKVSPAKNIHYCS